ncbi:hypothetical protein [Actinoallomurus soli]|uniref:hypothetical protein n=1 Tax=Actinoallomurus soli TaxID=2952535 RepID=UPI0020934F7D|nr:hypothetical protein [Actinoallomurus soli]MCO5968979.1 hypothetical protein [Actinoallomurus soli]
MSACGRQVLAAALKAIHHNYSATLDSYRGQAEMNQVNTEYADVPQLFASYGMTDPANSQSAVDDLFSVADNLDPANAVKVDPQSGDSGKQLLSPLPKHTGGWTDRLSIAERTSDIGAHLREWHGDARIQFDTFFVNHIGTAVPLQAALARSLALILQAHQEVRARANADVWEIGQKTIKALHAELAMCNCSPSAVTATITVGTAAASVLTAGGALAAAMAAFSFANAVTNAAIAGSREDKAKVSGATPLAILANMRTAIGKVKQAITDQERALASLTNTLADNVSSVGERMEIPSPNDAPGFRTAIQNPDSPRGFRPSSL